MACLPSLRGKVAHAEDRFAMCLRSTNRSSSDDLQRLVRTVGTLNCDCRIVNFFNSHLSHSVFPFVSLTLPHCIMESQKSASTYDDASLSKEVDLNPAGTQAASDTDSESQQWAKIKAVQRKVDFRILLWYSFVYLVMRIHVSNITNTAIMNEEQGDSILDQLSLGSQQWAWCLRSVLCVESNIGP